ncbi:hypothetical protein G9409_07525 [Chlorobium sp. BLA1]|nr:hypothetical protein [Candidatus Chlorobium masyuteum]NHQ60439.1 hypothetical protein [Candidatus Chlorobium masyuteum]NTU43983.1 hypothetical protein [Chlorobiaceae bacterium]
MSVEESNEFDELMEIVNEEESAEPAGEKSSEEKQEEIPIAGKGGTRVG